MLRKVRITTAVICLAVITLLFLDFSGTLHGWFGWLARIQFLPALLALNAGVTAGLIILTLLFGRLYCSVICPLGVFQDVISWTAAKRKKHRFAYSQPLRWARFAILGLFIVALAAGVSSLAGLLDPYSAYGRIASSLFAPVYQMGNNLSDHIAERIGSYAFYPTEVWIRSTATLITAAATFVLITILAWRNGRTYCNTICPVGTVLGFLSRYSLYKPRIDTGKCNGCGWCARNCKASCIDPKEHTIDYSRCVTCFNCLEQCKQKAIRYEPQRKKKTEGKTGAQAVTQEQIDTARRTLLSTSVLWVSASLLQAQERKMDGGLAVIIDKKKPARSTPIVPPGAKSIRHFARHCTGCQLCVSACPNQVLRPSGSWDTFMQPEVSYERGYCRPECTRCADVCPTGAIRPINRADKSATQIGHAVWIRKNCVPLTDGVDCGNCARHCPAGAIQMVESDSETSDSPKIPVVNAERCIGCGACENLCPARPFSAIYIEGHEMHRTV